MARTVQQIYNIILTEKAKYSSLNSLDSTSTVALWRTIAYVIAVVIATFEQLLDVFHTELLEEAEKLPTGTKEWYARKALDYQEGYSLIYDRETGEIRYEVEDESAKIIKAATCLTEGRTVVLKVAKSDGSDGLSALTSVEKTSFNDYINQIKFAGTLTQVLSLPGDDIKLSMKIQVDKTKINSQGQGVGNESVYPVEEAITQYLLDFGNEYFDSSFILIRLIDAIQNVDGVINVNITQADAKPSSESSYTNILNTEMRSYNSASGYIVIDETHSLRDNITYI